MTYALPDEKKLAVETAIENWTADTDEQLRDSLTTMAERYGLTSLLAHCDDGVVWGRFDQTWAFSGDTFPTVSPPLCRRALQQCRVFGPTAELYIWREAGELRTRLLVEPSESSAAPSYPYFDRHQLLWGDGIDGSPADGFTLLREGRQGLRHAVPLDLSAQPPHDAHRAALLVRHYVGYTQDQQAFVRYSRLVELKPR